MDFLKNYGIILFFPFVFFIFYKPAISFLMLGTLLLFLAIQSIIFFIQIRKNGIENVGKIISYESDDEGYKTPIIEFQISEEKSFRGKPSFHASTDLDKFQSYNRNINKTIKIIYNPENPEKFITKNNSNGCGLIMLIFVGTIFTVLSIGSLLGYIDVF